LRKLWEITFAYAATMIALVLAAVFGILGALNVVSPTVTDGLVMTTLAVLAVVTVRDRAAMSESRKIVASLPSRLARIDELSQRMGELQKLAEGGDGVPGAARVRDTAGPTARPGSRPSTGTSRAAREHTCAP
jgi:hypothetical protein